MKTFKSISDLAQIQIDLLRDTISRLITTTILTHPDYNPENDGYVVLIESDDVGHVLESLNLPYRLSEMPFEAVRRLGSYFLASYVPNNQFVLSFLIPDEPWIDGALRSHLESHLDL